MDFTQFYLAYEVRTLRYLQSKVNHDDAEDVASEVWLKVSRHFDHLDQPTRYLNKTIRTCIADYYRKRKEEVSLEALTLDETFDRDTPATDRDDTHDRALTNLTLERAKDVLNGLTPVTRDALAAYASGYRVDADGGLRVAVHRARQEVRRECQLV